MFSIKIDFSKEFASLIMDNNVNHFNLLQISVEYYKGQGDEEYKILETFCEKWGIIYNNLDDDEVASLYKEMDKAINAIMRRYNIYHLI